MSLVPDGPLKQASAALGRGDPLGALSCLGVRDDAHALAVRGIALAQLGEFERAKDSLTAARARFERTNEPLWAAKTMAALAEIGFATRDLDFAWRHLDHETLALLGDRASASYVALQKARLAALLGKEREAASAMAFVERGEGSAAQLARAEILARRGKYGEAANVATRAAQAAGAGAARIAGATYNPLLAGEARRLAHALATPAFVWRLGAGERPISLLDLEALETAYVCVLRRQLRAGRFVLDLSRRSAQLELLLALARGPVTAESLFGRTNEALAARLRMEITRLRQDAPLLVDATDAGFVARPAVAVLLPENGSELESLLADGEAWPPRALAAVLGDSVRTVERKLKDHPHIAPEGSGRARRYRLKRGRVPIATRLLLLTRDRDCTTGQLRAVSANPR